MSTANQRPIFVIILQGVLSKENFDNINAKLTRHLSGWNHLLLDGGEYTTVNVFGLDESNWQDFEELKEKVLKNV